MRILPIIAHLKAECPLLVNRVEPAKSLTALSDDEIKTGLPIAFVYATKESGTADGLIGQTTQHLHKLFSVIIAAKNADDSSEFIEDVRDQIEHALIGYQPDSKHQPIEFVGGEIVNVTSSIVWWKDTYKTSTYNRGHGYPG